jgi:hypothetical protein
MVVVVVMVASEASEAGEVGAVEKAGLAGGGRGAFQDAINRHWQRQWRDCPGQLLRKQVRKSESRSLPDRNGRRSAR